MPIRFLIMAFEVSMPTIQRELLKKREAGSVRDIKVSERYSIVLQSTID